MTSDREMSSASEVKHATADRTVNELLLLELRSQLRLRRAEEVRKREIKKIAYEFAEQIKQGAITLPTALFEMTNVR